MKVSLGKRGALTMRIHVTGLTANANLLDQTPNNVAHDFWFLTFERNQCLNSFSFVITFQSINSKEQSSKRYGTDTQDFVSDFVQDLFLVKGRPRFEICEINPPPDLLHVK